MSRTMASLCGALVLVCSGVAGAAGIRGEYMEARTADVLHRPLLLQRRSLHLRQPGRHRLEGDRRLLGRRRPRRPERRGRRPRHHDLLGRPARPSPLRPDRRPAGDLSPARGPGGDGQGPGGSRLANVVDVKSAPIRLKIEAHSTADVDPHMTCTGCRMPPRLLLGRGPGHIVTRPLDDGDHFCGNEVVAYEPLSKGTTSCRPTPSATSSRARASTPAGTTRTAGAASSATSPIDRTAPPPDAEESPDPPGLPRRARGEPSRRHDRNPRARRGRKPACISATRSCWPSC